MFTVFYNCRSDVIDIRGDSQTKLDWCEEDRPVIVIFPEKAVAAKSKIHWLI